MAVQTFTLAVADLVITPTSNTWEFADPRPQFIAALTDGDDRYFSTFKIQSNNGSVEISCASHPTASDTQNKDLSDLFESSGRFRLETSLGVLDVLLDGADSSDKYDWSPSNSAEVMAYAIAMQVGGPYPGTLTISDGPFGPDRPAAPTLTGTHNSITAVGVEPNDRGNPITSYDWRYKRTSTNVWGERNGQTDLTQVFLNLAAATEYEVQFAATNSDRTSDYSPSGIFTTDDQPGPPPPGFTDIPDPVAGDEWDLDDFVLWVVNNIQAVHALYVGTTPGSTFNQNDVVIGGSGGAFVGVPLSDGSLLVGSGGAPVALAPGTPGQRLRDVNGVVQWVTP